MFGNRLLSPEACAAHYSWAAKFFLATALVSACSSEVGGGSDSPLTGPSGSAASPGAAPVDPNTGLPVQQTDPMTGLPVANPQPGTNTTPATPTVGADGNPLPAQPGVTDPANPANTPGMTPAPSECVQGVPGTSEIPRLTNAQYDRTIADLVGVTALTSGSAPSSLLATEQAGDITSLAWSGYQNAAKTIAQQVMADPTLTAKFMTCTPSGDGKECLASTISEFGRRAYRRPLTTEEIADFQAIVDQGSTITATGTPAEIAEVVLNAFLTSPSFLQRSEIQQTANADGNFPLSSWEVASRLSYMLWGTMPDQMLADAADNNELSTKEQVLAQAQRMVADPRAASVASEFHRGYLHLTLNSRWDTTKKDPTLFPGFVDGIVPDLINETQTLISDVYTSGGSFQDLFTTTAAYVTAKTAPLYGLDPANYGDTPTKVDLDATTRPGFLTRGAFLSAYSGTTATSPILRGVFITREILGINPGTPDPNATKTALPTGTDLDTNRKRYTELTKNQPCAGCHETFVNPPGFVLEAFDTTGKAQTTEADTGAAIDTVADVRFAADANPVTVHNPAELMTMLSTAPAAQRFYAEKLAAFAYERALTGPDKCTVDTMSQHLTAGGYSIQNLLADLTQADYFTVRALEEEVTQ